MHLYVQEPMNISSLMHEELNLNNKSSYLQAILRMGLYEMVGNVMALVIGLYIEKF
jgi:hypothetical protein